MIVIDKEYLGTLQLWIKIASYFPSLINSPNPFFYIVLLVSTFIVPLAHLLILVIPKHICQKLFSNFSLKLFFSSNYFYFSGFFPCHIKLDFSVKTILVPIFWPFWIEQTNSKVIFSSFCVTGGTRYSRQISPAISNLEYSQIKRHILTRNFAI